MSTSHRSRPFVTVHVAQSVDGRLALAGQTTALSTVEGQQAAHAARAAHDAVVVGSNTVRIDDPRLTVRHAPGRTPLRVILASRLDVPPSAKIFSRERADARAGGAPRSGASDLPVLVVGAEGRAGAGVRAELISRGVEVDVVAATDDGLISLAALLTLLRDRGVERVLVEGGARVLTSFFRERLVDRVEIEISMRLLGAPGTMTLGPLGIDAQGAAIDLVNVTVERLGVNVLVRADVAPPRGSGRAS